jgi:hypothetical protein
MHKNFRGSNQKCSLIFDLLNKNYGTESILNTNQYNNLTSILNRENVKNLIQKRIISIGKLVPISEQKIEKRLINFLKKNRAAMRYEDACCRYIRQFDAAAFFVCEVCEFKNNNLSWEQCKSCGAYNDYKI